MDHIHKDSVVVIGYAPPLISPSQDTSRVAVLSIHAISAFTHRQRHFQVQAESTLSYFPARAQRSIYTPSFLLQLLTFSAFSCYSEPFSYKRYPPLHFLKKKLDWIVLSHNVNVNRCFNSPILLLS